MDRCMVCGVLLSEFYSEVCHECQEEGFYYDDGEVKQLDEVGQ